MPFQIRPFVHIHYMAAIDGKHLVISPCGTHPTISLSFCLSWTVPPLLGIAYVVLGGLLPRNFEALLLNVNPDPSPDNDVKQEGNKVDVEKLKMGHYWL
jgi:hypothetical protein